MCKVNDLSKDEWRQLIAGIPEDVKKEIGRLKSAGPSEKFATDRTARKVAAFQHSNIKLPPALDELEHFIFHRLSAKLPVTDSFYNSFGGTK
ncbi:hypothetical protein WJX77_003329 [Trebouxia sp. C0004]